VLKCAIRFVISVSCISHNQRQSFVMFFCFNLSHPVLYGSLNKKLVPSSAVSLIRWNPQDLTLVTLHSP